MLVDGRALFRHMVNLLVRLIEGWRINFFGVLACAYNHI